MQRAIFIFYSSSFFLRPMVSAGWLVRRKDWTWELLLTLTVVDVLASPLCFTLIKRERFLSYVAMVNNLDICRVGLDNASRVCHFRIQTLVKIGTRIPAIWVKQSFTWTAVLRARAHLQRIREDAANLGSPNDMTRAISISGSNCVGDGGLHPCAADA